MISFMITEHVSCSLEPFAVSHEGVLRQSERSVTQFTYQLQITAPQMVRNNML